MDQIERPREPLRRPAAGDRWCWTPPSAWLPARMEAVEERLRRWPRATARRSRPTPAVDARGRGQAPAPDAGPAERRAAGRARWRSAPRPRSSSSTWRPSSTTTCSTRRRFGAASPTVVARSGRDRGAGGRRPALLARLRRARPASGTRAAGRAAVRASVALALGELAQRRDAFDPRSPRSATCERCELKTARLFECACLIGRVDARCGARRRSGALRTFGREIGLAFQLLDDVLDVTGPPERTGKARGTDLLDGTVTLPLILARERDASLAELDLRGARPPRREALCDRIAATGVLDEVRAGARSAASSSPSARSSARAARARAAPAARAGRRRRRRALLLSARGSVAGPRSPRGGCGPRGARRRSARSGPPCWPGSRTFRSSSTDSVPRSSASSRRSTTSWR